MTADTCDVGLKLATIELGFYLTAGLLIVSENVLLIGIVLRHESLHTAKYIFTCSLAISDLLVGVICTFIPSLNLIMGRVECSVGSPLLLLMAGLWTLSVTNMAVIAAERYIYIARPYLYQVWVTARKVTKFLAVFWTFGVLYLFSICFAELYVLGNRFALISDVDAGLKYGCFVPVYVIMTSVSLVLYVLILLQVRKHRSTIISTCCWEGQRPSNAFMVKWKDNVRCLKFFVTVFGLYFLMTLPFFVLDIATGFHGVHGFMRHGVLLSMILNSGVNFLVLNAVDKHFRRVLATSVGKLIHRVTLLTMRPSSRTSRS